MADPRPLIALDLGTTGITVCAASDTEVTRLGADGRPPQARVDDRVVRHLAMTSEARVRAAITHVRGRLGVAPGVVLMLPTHVSGLAHRAAQDAAKAAGAAGIVYGADQALAAAVGTGVSIDQGHVAGVVDIGGGVTQTAVLDANTTVRSAVASVGSFDIDVAIRVWLQRDHGVEVSLATAEQIKRTALAVGNDRHDSYQVEIFGRGIGSPLPAKAQVTVGEIRETVELAVAAIVDTASDALADLPLRIDRRLRRQGIVLVGGGALLDGMAERFSDALHMPARVAADADTAIVAGMRALLDDLADRAA